MECFQPGHWVIIPFEGLENELETLVKLLAIVYKHFYLKVLCFVMNHNAGYGLQGFKYKAQYWTENGSNIVKMYDHPFVITQYFSVVGTVENHKMSFQGKLALNKAWKTHNPYYYFLTSMLGVTLTDL